MIASGVWRSSRRQAMQEQSEDTQLAFVHLLLQFCWIESSLKLRSINKIAG